MLTESGNAGTIDTLRIGIYQGTEEQMDVYAKVKDIVVELLEVDPDEVTRDASFRDTLEADSLDLVELLMAFEDEFGATIPDEDVKQINTVGDAVVYIERRMQEES
jgi:acyl carrier protein